MLHLRMSIPAHLTDDVVGVLSSEPTVSSLSTVRGASLLPDGDLVYADITREHANGVILRLRELGVPHLGTLHIDPVPTWLSRAGLDAEERAPGAAADAVVWPEVGARAYADSELNGTYLLFIVLATMIAAIAIVLDSQILVIGSMVLGPEFGPIAALGLALVLRRRALFGLALRTLVVGFVVAIATTSLAALAARAAGWITPAVLTAARPATGFIYRPDKWTFVVAVLAAVAGVISLTSGRSGGLVGVFISVTTIPAAGNIALGLALWSPSEIVASATQLGINLASMTIAGWVTLAVQELFAGRWTSQRLRDDLRRRRRADMLQHWDGRPSTGGDDPA